MTRKKLLALTGSVCLVLVLVALPFISACAPEAPPPPPPPPPPPEEEEEAPAPTPEKVITLRYADASKLGTEGSRTWLIKQVCEEIEKLTEGRVKFEYYWMGSLANDREMLDALRWGAVDIGKVSANLFIAQLPMTNVVGAVPFKPSTREGMAKAFPKLLQTPESLAEWEAVNLKVIGFVQQGKNIICTEPLRSLGDIKGVKGRMGEEASQKIWAAAGGILVSMTFGEIWENLDKGIIDAAESSIDIMLRFEFYEVAPYFHDISMAIHPTPYAMNLDTFNNLSPDIQEIVLQSFSGMSQRFNDVTAANEESWKKQLEEYGVEFISFPEAELDKWRSLPDVQAISDDWVKEWEDQGQPGRAIMDAWLKILP